MEKKTNEVKNEDLEPIELDDQDLEQASGGLRLEEGDNNVTQCGCNVVQGCSC